VGDQREITAEETYKENQGEKKEEKVGSCKKNTEGTDTVEKPKQLVGKLKRVVKDKMAKVSKSAVKGKNASVSDNNKAKEEDETPSHAKEDDKTSIYAEGIALKDRSTSLFEFT
jgi:hypothetical protein